jgi:hypothetical protein
MINDYKYIHCKRTTVTPSHKIYNTFLPVQARADKHSRVLLIPHSLKLRLRKFDNTIMHIAQVELA